MQQLPRASRVAYIAAATECGVDLWHGAPGLPPWSALADDERTRVLRAMLVRMQGDRSASCLTWLNDDGVVRIDGAPVDAATRDADRRLARAELIAAFRQVAALRVGES